MSMENYHGEHAAKNTLRTYARPLSSRRCPAGAKVRESLVVSPEYIEAAFAPVGATASSFGMATHDHAAAAACRGLKAFGPYRG